MEMSTGEFVTYTHWSKLLHLRSGTFTFSNTNLILVIKSAIAKAEKLCAKVT